MTPKIAGLLLCGALLGAGGAMAQTTTHPAGSPAGAGTAPHGTPSQDARPRATAPVPGANSFTEGQARGRIEQAGFSGVTDLRKDDNGIWRGRATRNGAATDVALDYQGNVFSGAAAAAGHVGTTTTGAADRPAGASAPRDGTPGNPPGTAATRAADRAAGTNMSGAYPNQSDGTPANPPGTAVGRAVDRATGSNTTGTNPQR
ncbi:hypothetical protein M0638_17300 [Roseomonas sp. NAR14]|uniref:PepSY domain-containing protein n=1 Tax=Roseomonas acroporae TaxID=2937791 RepID=A0A9X2BXN3_9PROT|nr:hypothetical protein [Roseomonas acroporae]MCK8786134.1 hypothetical protein [Roseomonas acroporae]